MEIARLLHPGANGPAVFCLRVFICSVFPAGLLAGAAYWISILLGTQSGPQRDASDFEWLAAAVGIIVAPLVESLILRGFCSLLMQAAPYRAAPSYAAVVGILAGGLHATVAPLWFFASAWSFFVFTLAWLNWKNCNEKYGWTVLVLPHCLQNLTAYLIAAALA